ncbi:MAG TPA: SpoIIE family protein phosphatase, partial [Pseudonocardia sp.]|nr:SpoIIE family protein phosphatase [Pseudonocardia sp.]
GLTAATLIPLVVGDRCLGVVGAGFVGERRFPASDRAAATAAAELAAQALDRANLLLAETAGRRAAERLGAVATALSRATDLDAVAAVTIAHGRAAVEADGVVMLVESDEGPLRLLVGEGWPDMPPDLPRDADHPLARAVRDAEPVWRGEPGQGGDPLHLAVPLLVGGRAIGALGFRFATRPALTRQRRSLMLTLASQCAQAVMRARLHQAEHEVAVTLQRSLLPQRMPHLDRLALATRYQPGTAGTEAGGDWFDVLDLGAGIVALVVGDVVGRGPAAAAVMGQLRSALAANLVNGQPPASALEQLDLFARRVEGALASTVACALIDTASGELRYASAGHPPPLVAGPGGVRMLDEGRGTPLGVVGRPPFAEAVECVAPGETILLCSDGLFERRTEVVDDGLHRLAATFGPMAASRPELIADSLLDRMLPAGSSPDDVALVVARLLPPPLRLSPPAVPQQLAVVRREVERWCALAGVHPDARTDLQLALGEAVTNAVEHAYSGAEPGTVWIELDLDRDGSVLVRVADTGRWRPPPEDRGYRGRGLALIRDLTAELHVESSPDGTVVRFRLPPVPLEGPRSGRGAAVPGAAPEPVDTGAGDHGGRPGSTRVRRVAEGPGTRLYVEGDLDLAGVAEVRSPLLEQLARDVPITLVLDEACWVSSAGIALLSELAHRSRHRLRVVTPAGGPARRVLGLAGLDRVLDVAVEDAAHS